MSTISRTRKNVTSGKNNKKLGVSSFTLFPPLSLSDEDAFQSKPELLPSATENALEELEEKYQDLLRAVDVDKLNPKYLTRYIKRAEERRGGPFTKEEKTGFREMATSKDPEVKRLLALELRVGVPKKVEIEALAAMGNLLLHRDDTRSLEAFIEKPEKDPNLREWVRTTLMMNRVEFWMGRYQHFKSWAGRFNPFQKHTEPKLAPVLKSATKSITQRVRAEKNN